MIMLVAASGILIMMVLVIGARQYDYMVYGKCIADTDYDINRLLDQFKDSNYKGGQALSVKMTECVEDVFFVNGNEWKTLGTGSKEIKCNDDADAHIVIVRRSYNLWKLIRSGSTKIAKTELMAPDTICKDIYGMTFNNLDNGGEIEGSSDSKTYCVMFEINRKLDYININNIEEVNSKEKCVI